MMDHWRTQDSRIAIVYFDAGGGHRNAATALSEIARRQQRPWDIELVHLQELLDSIDPVLKLSGIRSQDVYNIMLRKGWTLGSAQLLRLLHVVIDANGSKLRDTLAAFWKTRNLDLVVSVIPNFNRIIAASLMSASSDAPFVTILTDFADYSSHFWMERESQYLVCGTEKAERQGLTLGHDANVLRTSGMILHPKFYYRERRERRAARLALSLDPAVPTALVLLGGQGSAKMLKIARQIDRCTTALQVIYICGHNAELRNRLLYLPTKHKKLVVGFTPDIPSYMEAADFLIGKPGPGCISEAIHMGLPVVVESNAWTLPQERYNAEWVAEKGLGFAVRDFAELPAVISKLFDENLLSTMQTRALSLRNTALFEIADWLEHLLRRHAKPEDCRLPEREFMRA